jgi:hypothetical protein
MMRRPFRAALAATLALASSPLFAGTERSGDEIRVSLDTNTKQRYPSAALDSQGGAFVVWEKPGAGILGRRLSLAGGAGGGEMVLAANVPLSTTNGQGRAVDQREPMAISDGGSGFYLFWTRERSFLVTSPFHERRDITDRDVMCRHFGADGSALSAPVIVHANSIGFQSQPRLAMQADGSLFAVWYSDDRDAATSANDGLFGRIFAPNCVARGEAFRITNPVTGPNVANAALTAAGNRVAVVWEARDGDATGVFRKLFDNVGIAQGTQLRVNGTTAGRQGVPAVAHREGSGYLVLWQGQTGERLRTRIYSQRLSEAGDLVGDETVVSEGVGEYETDPSVVASGGGFYAVWMKWDKTFPLALRGVDLDANGAPAVDSSAVNTFQPGAQHRTFLTVDAAGRVLAVWEGYFERQRRPGISAQLLTAE